MNELAKIYLYISFLIRPTEEELKDYGHADFTVIAAPGFKCNAKIDGINSSAAIIIDYEAKVGIICGTEYSGEIKKSVFSIMNFVMPEMDVLPMHCLPIWIQTLDRLLYFRAFRNWKNYAFNRS